MTEEINMKEMWNEYHENVLRQWGEASACYRYMHHRSFLLYKKLSLRFNLPVIVLSTVTGTANFAQNTFPPSMRGTVPAIIGGMNLIAGLIATIMQFLKINELIFIEWHELFYNLQHEIKMKLNELLLFLNSL